MTAGLGRGLALAGIGAAVGLAVVAALFGTGDLLKRVRGPAASGEIARPAADLPPAAKSGAGPDTEKPRTGAGDRAAIDPGANPLAGPGDAPQGESRRDGGQAAEPAAPSLDILRVEPTGETVLAGRGPPKASVELLRDDKPVARATADESGQFAMDGLTLPPGNSELTLRSTGPDGRTTQSRASAVVVVDAEKKAQPLVAVSEPDKPTRVLSMPSAPEAKTAKAGKETGSDRSGSDGTLAQAPSRREAAVPGPGGKPGSGSAEATPVRIVSVDAQDGGRLFVSGQGAAWTSLRLYLNDTMVASGRSGADGRIGFTIGRGVKPGGYQIRIDQVDDASGKVGQRAQVGFNFPVQLAGKETAKEAGKEAAKAPARPSSKEASLRPEARLPHGAETPPAIAGAGRPNTAVPTPETDRRTAEAPSPKLLGDRTPPGGDAGTADRSATAPGDVGPGLPTNPPDAPPRLAERSPASPQSPDMALSSKSSEGPAAVFVPEIDTAKIIRGDNLWQISRRSYGDGKRYTVIYQANREQIRDPNLIYPGQIFVMPKDASKDAPKETPAAGGAGAKRG